MFVFVSGVVHCGGMVVWWLAILQRNHWKHGIRSKIWEIQFWQVHAVRVDVHSANDKFYHADILFLSVSEDDLHV